MKDAKRGILVECIECNKEAKNVCDFCGNDLCGGHSIKYPPDYILCLRCCQEEES